MQVSMKSLQGGCHHEIGTHMVRFCNNHLQSWHCSGPHYDKRYAMGLSEVYGAELQGTEEGLAVINGFFEQPIQSLYYGALHYYTAIQAHRMDFVDLYRHLERFVSCPVRRWNQCVRTRKGVKDQGRFGAFRRDQAYFVGAVDLLRSRRTINFRELHCAKISLRDYRGLRGQIRMNGCIIPPFLHDMQKYGEHLDSVAEQNFVDECFPRV